jgi:outer membrane protein assembly factor BamA
MIEEGVQPLRNLGIFREVTFTLAEGAGAETPDESDAESCAKQAPTVRLAIKIDEKWTTLPLFSFSRGGGTYRLILGAYDVNFLGRYISVGAQYERLGDTNSFFAWASQPRLFDRRVLAGVSAGTRNQVYYLYEPDGSIGGGFLLHRFSAEATIQKEWLWWLRTGLTLHFDVDDFSLELLSDEARRKQLARGVPESTHTLLAGVGALFGRLDRHNFLVDGALLSVAVEHANENLGSSHNYSALLLGTTYFQTLPWRSTLGVRAATGFASTRSVHRRFYLGGLDAIRGFPKDRFSGENYWLSTVEFRIPSVDTRWFVLQHIFFVDAAGVSDNVSDLARLSGASAGVGLRIMVPKIQDFVIRVDYAFPLYGDAANPLSLGGGQFF